MLGAVHKLYNAKTVISHISKLFNIKSNQGLK